MWIYIEHFYGCTCICTINIAVWCAVYVEKKFKNKYKYTCIKCEVFRKNFVSINTVLFDVWIDMHY